MMLTKESLKTICKDLKSSGKKIVFTNGCFDILHLGHIKYLSDSKKNGDILIVGVNSDESVRKLKGESRPINSESDRALILSELKSVDFTVIFDEDTPYNLIELIKPDVITKGGDYNPSTIVGADIVASYGGSVVVINFVEGKSTTSIINMMTK